MDDFSLSGQRSRANSTGSSRAEASRYDRSRTTAPATSHAILRWQEEHAVEWHYIAPAIRSKRFVESLTGRLRDECLNEHLFRSLSAARTIIEAWRSTTTPAARTRASAAHPERVCSPVPTGPEPERTLVMNGANTGQVKRIARYKPDQVSKLWYNSKRNSMIPLNIGLNMAE